ncbi:MAG: hypothetical protein MZV65_18770 [Chromatiales bacterium]|nr:hypothetical protein [Chromatiales bacterium]
MKRKIALKRLSASDLTLFEYHYRNTSGAKQKAINLDASVFVGALFPGLPGGLDVFRDRVISHARDCGPGAAGAHSSHQKNTEAAEELASQWRTDLEPTRRAMQV